MGKIINLEKWKKKRPSSWYEIPDSIKCFKLPIKDGSRCIHMENFNDQFLLALFDIPGRGTVLYKIDPENKICKEINI